MNKGLPATRSFLFPAAEGWFVSSRASYPPVHCLLSLFVVHVIVICNPCPATSRQIGGDCSHRWEGPQRREWQVQRTLELKSTALYKLHPQLPQSAQLSNTDKTVIVWMFPQIAGSSFNKKKKKVRRWLMWYFTPFSFAFRLKTLIQRVAKEYRELFNR